MTKTAPRKSRVTTTFEQGTSYAPELLAAHAAQELRCLLRHPRYDAACRRSSRPSPPAPSVAGKPNPAGAPAGPAPDKAGIPPRCKCSSATGPPPQRPAKALRSPPPS